MTMAPSSEARLLHSSLTDRELARWHEFCFHLQPRYNPNKVLMRKQFLDDAFGKHGRRDRALRTVSCNGRELLPHIGRDINAGGGPQTLRLGRCRLHGILAFHPAPGKGRGRAWSEDEAGDTLTCNDMGVAWPMIGQTFFTEKVAWSKHGEEVAATLRGFP